MEPKKASLADAFKNNIYAMRLGFSTSKSRVIHSFVFRLIYYFTWVFFSGYFLKHIIAALENEQDFQSILAFILIWGGVFFVVNLYYEYIENVVYPLTATKLYHGIYRKLYQKARNVELRCYEDPDFYNRYTMAVDGAEEKVTTIIDSVWGILLGTIAAGVVFYAMFTIHPLSVLFILSPMIGNFVFGNTKNKFEFQRYQEQAVNDKVLNYVNRVMYLPDYAKEIRLSKVFSLLKKQYNEATDGNVKIAKKYAFRLGCMNLGWAVFTFTVIFEGVMLFAVYENLVKHTITLAELTVMTSLMVSATWILIGVFNDVMATIKNGMFINNLRGFLEYEEKLPENQDGIMPADVFETLSFENVSFSYKDELTIENLSFGIKAGEKIALVGHNGAGKSTIIKLLLRLYDPTQGVIKVNGIDIKEYNLHAYRNLFAAAFQDYCIFGMTVKDNVLMGRHFEQEEEQVAAALRHAGVFDKISSLPKGIHTMMTKEFDDEGAVLSGGESQKIVVARAFVKPSPIRIFDEPSSALDPIAEYELFNNIMRDGEKHTMVFISHRLSSVKNADRVFMLENGHIIESGTHHELINLDGSYAEMYKMQAMNYLAVDTVEGVAL